MKEEPQLTPYPLPGMYPTCAIVCREAQPGPCPPATRHSPPRCPPAAAPDRTGRRGNSRPRAGSDGRPTYGTVDGVPPTDRKGEQRFYGRKMGESAQGDGGMPRETSPVRRRSYARAPLWPTWGWPQVRARFWLQKKPSKAAAVIAASLRCGSGCGPAPRGVKHPKERRQRAPVLNSCYPASRRGVPGCPKQLGGTSADLGVPTRLLLQPPPAFQSHWCLEALCF